MRCRGLSISCLQNTAAIISDLTHTGHAATLRYVWSRLDSMKITAALIFKSTKRSFIPDRPLNFTALSDDLNSCCSSEC